MRLNILLFLSLLISAIGVIALRYTTHKLYTQINQLQSSERHYQIEWTQLQLENSTWGAHDHLTKIATHSLQMNFPSNEQTKTISISYLESSTQ